jgi:hypothetical protein
VGQQSGLNVGIMTSINYNTQLLMLGGWTGNYISDIWKFTLANSSWESMGKLPSVIGQITGFTVSGLKC